MALDVTSHGAWNGDRCGSSFFRRINGREEIGEVALGPTLCGLQHTIGALSKEDAASEADIAIARGRKMLVITGRHSQKPNRRTQMTAATIASDPMKKTKSRT